MTRLGALLAVSLPLAAGTAHAPEGAIVTQIQGARSDVGEVLCSLYRDAAGFPSHADLAVQKTRSKIVGGTATCTFAGVPAGRYAIALFHDENGNGKLDANLVGIPKEGYGSSNDSHHAFGPPKLEEAAFTYDGKALSLTVHLFY